MTDLSYKEKSDRLNVRIQAHKRFANFDINDWIKAFVGRRPRRAILDLACGNGNHLGIYLEQVGEAGRVAGIDREAKLIEEARATYPDAGNLELRVGSMDERLPWDDGSFDLAFSNFAIYNAADPGFTLGELKRVLAPGGELVLIGPTAANAKEIYEFNERLTGVAIDPITFVRTDRLRQEILPIARTVFGNAREEVINSELTFPDQDEWLRYYTSTMVYEEGAEKAGYTWEQMRAACTSERDIVLSKEMLAVVCETR